MSHAVITGNGEKMINPILIVIAAAVFLSAAVITFINRPKFPLTAATLLVILIFFLFATFSIDQTIMDVSGTGAFSQFVKFSVMNDKPSYEYLETSFTVFSCIDIGLFIASLISMFIETLSILHKNSKI